ncbi:MAG: hypothetical protein R3F47_18655 [Gammaproteobacteria bacterium]
MTGIVVGIGKLFSRIFAVGQRIVAGNAVFIGGGPAEHLVDLLLTQALQHVGVGVGAHHMIQGVAIGQVAEFQPVL